VRHASLLWIGYIFTALLLVQAAPITRLVFYPEEVSIIGDEVSLARSFPMDAMGLSRPFLSFSEVVRPLTPSHNNGQSCETVAGRFNTPEPQGWASGQYLGRHTAWTILLALSGARGGTGISARCELGQ